MNLPPIHAPASITNQSNNSNLGWESMRIMVMMVPSMPWSSCHDLDDLCRVWSVPDCLWEYLLAINSNPIFSNVLHSENRTSSNDAKINLNNQQKKARVYGSIRIIVGIDKSSSSVAFGVSLRFPYQMKKGQHLTFPCRKRQRASILRWPLCESRNFTTSTSKMREVSWTLHKDDCQVSIKLDTFSSRKVMAR